MSAMLWKVGFILRKFVKVIIGCGLFLFFSALYPWQLMVNILSMKFQICVWFRISKI